METHGILKAFPKVKRHRSNETKDAPAVKKPSGLPITGNAIQYINQMCAAVVKIMFNNHSILVLRLSIHLG